MTSPRIEFEPVGRRAECPPDQSLLDCARQLGIGIASLCGGQGTCHSCKIQVLSGAISAPTSHDLETFSPHELQAGWRLACQTYPSGDCKLNVPVGSMTTPQRTQIEGLEALIQPDPPVRAYHLKLPDPSLLIEEECGEHLLETLTQQHRLQCRNIDSDVLHMLPFELEIGNREFGVSVRHDEVIALGPWPCRQLGLAIDLGTTKIAGYLIDLATGRTLTARGIMNPQIGYGEDVISRITWAMKSTDNRAQLQKLVVEALNQMAADLCTEANFHTDEIVETVLVGNTAMHHLFLALPIQQLASFPFQPAVSNALDIKAREVGLQIAPGGYIHLLPNIAGFVGGDHVAMLLATEAPQADGIALALDIGTNTEVSLVDHGKITAASCASGPAFEGGHINDGMRAAGGAIERVRIEGDSVQYQTIDDAAPAGICGSGIVDAVAQMYQAGIIDRGGRMKDGHPRVRTRQNKREFVLADEGERNGHPDIIVTQGDIREVQLAKAAIRTGIQILLDTSGRSEKDIDQVIIAGAFGSYIDITSAITIGMLPSLPADRFRQVGNAAGTGAKLALISLRKRNEAQDIASRVGYVELASAPDFTQVFVQASYLDN